MIIKKILGNLEDYKLDDLTIHWLDMPFDHAHKRIQRLKSEDGKEFGIRLTEEDRQIGLKHGDIIYKDGNEAYVINIEEEECLKVFMDSEEDMVNLGYIIGNRHAKLYWTEDKKALLVPYEKTIHEMLSAVENIHIEKAFEKLLPKNNLMAILPQDAISEHDHEHDHDHEH